MAAPGGSRATCRALRTKMRYVAGIEDDGRPAECAASGTAQYWCLRTMTQVGLDERLVVPEHCRQGRACWEGDDGTEPDGAG